MASGKLIRDSKSIVKGGLRSNPISVTLLLCQISNGGTGDVTSAPPRLLSYGNSSAAT